MIKHGPRCALEYGAAGICGVTRACAPLLFVLRAPCAEGRTLRAPLGILNCPSCPAEYLPSGWGHWRRGRAARVGVVGEGMGCASKWINARYLLNLAFLDVSCRIWNEESKNLYSQCQG